MKNIGNTKVLVLWINPIDGIISRLYADLQDDNCFAQFIGVGQNDCAMQSIGDGLYATHDSNAITLDKEDQHRFTFMNNDFINDIVVWQVCDQSNPIDIQIDPEDAWMLLSDFDSREEGWGHYDEKDSGKTEFILDYENNTKLH
jgi:hypothetical protein